MNYIIPRFVLDELPLGLAGLFIAAVHGRRDVEHRRRAQLAVHGHGDRLLPALVSARGDATRTSSTSRSVATAVWGVFACIVATYAATLGSLIEVVNRFGSFFYGSILGVFMLAMIPRTRALGAFVGLLAGMGAVAAVTFGAPSVSFLWHNVIGAVTVVAVGSLFSFGGPARPAATG